MHERLNRKADLFLEYPIRATCGNMFVDIFVNDKGERFAIELKYKTRDLKHDVYSLKKHGAHNLGRYDYLADLMRIESFINKGEIDAGYAIMLTNDDLYWEESEKTASTPFPISGNTIIQAGMQLSFDENASRGGIGKCRLENPIQLMDTYQCKWKNYSHLCKDARGGMFRYLLLEAKRKMPAAKLP